MAVRNFWIEADIDGRQTVLAGGPRSKDGGMTITIYQRKDGGITEAVKIRCEARGDELRTEIVPTDGLVSKVITKR